MKPYLLSRTHLNRLSGVQWFQVAAADCDATDLVFICKRSIRLSNSRSMMSASITQNVNDKAAVLFQAGTGDGILPVAARRRIRNCWGCWSRNAVVVYCPLSSESVYLPYWITSTPV